MQIFMPAEQHFQKVSGWKRRGAELSPQDYGRPGGHGRPESDQKS